MLFRSLIRTFTPPTVAVVNLIALLPLPDVEMLCDVRLNRIVAADAAVGTALSANAAPVAMMPRIKKIVFTESPPKGCDFGKYAVYG